MFSWIKKFFNNIREMRWLADIFCVGTELSISSEAVANYILELQNGEPLDIETLQKKLYLIQVEWLQDYGYCVIKTVFVARRFGPESRFITHKFWKKEQNTFCTPTGVSCLPEKVKKFIKRKLKKYQNNEQLTNRVKGSAWVQTWYGGEGDGKSISRFLMRRDYPIKRS